MPGFTSIVLLFRVELGSEEFSHQLQPFLFDKTEQFIHEFIRFARSPFDMTAYDERAQYGSPSQRSNPEIHQLCFTVKLQLWTIMTAHITMYKIIY